MSIVENITACLRRTRNPAAHLVAHIPDDDVQRLVESYGPLPSFVTDTVRRLGSVKLFMSKGVYANNYMMGLCYDLQMKRIGAADYYLNIAATKYDGAFYKKWCPKRRLYLDGIFGVRGAGLGKRFETIEEWFDVMLPRIRRTFDKAVWDVEYGMKDFISSGESRHNRR